MDHTLKGKGIINRMSRQLLSFLLLLVISGAAQAQSDNEPPINVEIIQNLTFAQYGEYKLHLDLYRPANISKKLPAIVVIREGGWAHADKETSKPIALALAQKGFVTVSIEYRGASEVSFPNYVYDVKAAVRWLRSHANTYNIDPNAIGAIGGSWGAFLTVYSGVTNGISELEGDGGFDDSLSDLSAMIGLSTPTNLMKFPKRMERYIGESYESNPELWEFASATTHVRIDSPPLLLIASEADDTVPFEQSLLMVQAYGDAGAEAEIVLLPNADHVFWNYYGEWFEDTITRSANFFHKHL